MMIVTDVSSSSGESPVSPDFIKDVIAKSNTTSTNELISELLLALAKKSSKHKFIVQATSVKTEDDNFNLKLSSDFGAVWESERDGYVNLKVQLGDVDQDEASSLTNQEAGTLEIKPVERADTLGGIVDHYIETVEPERYLVSVFWVFVG